MALEEIVQQKRDEIIAIAAKHGAYHVRIFGSVARGESGPDSDVDFLIDMDGNRSLLDMSGLWLELEELLGRKVNIAEPDAVHWYIRDRVIAEAKPL
jgi:predicted nucleotidyltransferase